MRWKHIAHAYVWQKMPRGLRRQALFHVTARLAPRPTPEASSNTPIVVAGLLRTASGLGEGARLCYDALSQHRQDVYGIDLSEYFPNPGPVVSFSFRDGRSIEGPGTIILHINGPFVPLALMRLGKRFIVGKRIVGYWAWELPEVPPEWRFGVPCVHEIWVPSRFTANAITTIADDVPVRVVPHPVAARGLTAIPDNRRRVGPFTALLAFNMASGFERKNPLATITAFKQAFGNDPTCRLRIAMLNANLYPHGYKALMTSTAGAPNIEIRDGTAMGSDVEETYLSADVVLSLHRSEGFGLVIAEAMLHGLPVLATNWSGNVDFLTSDNGLPVPYSLVPARDPQGTYHHPSSLWADADINDAANKLQMLRNDPDLRAALGRRAVADATSAFGVERYNETIQQALNL